MKININNWTLTCKKDHLICDGCYFDGKFICVRKYPILSKLCAKFDIIFVKHSSPSLFNL